MKLILENWNKYLIEEEIAAALKQKAFKSHKQLSNFLHEEYSKRGIYLTEEQLEEVMPAWLTKLGAKAALMAQLAGPGGPSQEYETDVGGDADAAAQQAEVEADFSKDYGNGASGKVFDNGDGTFNIEVESGENIMGNKTAEKAAAAMMVKSVASQLLKDFFNANPDLPSASTYELVNSQIIDGQQGHGSKFLTIQLVPITK